MALRRQDALPRPVSDDRDWTYERYCELPEDGKRYEVIRGELYMALAPSRPHQRAVLQLGSILNSHVMLHDLGEVNIAPFDVLLSRGNVFQPDILFVSKARMDVLNQRNARRQSRPCRRGAVAQQPRHGPQTEVGGLRRAWRCPLLAR